MMLKPSTIDDYLAGVNAVDRVALERLRRMIKAAAPKVEEVISYGMPAFKLDGRVLLGFAAARHHCALYPWSGATVKAHQVLLSGYSTSRGTIRFDPKKGLPATLVKTIVKARIAENKAKSQRAAAKARAKKSA